VRDRGSSPCDYFLPKRLVRELLPRPRLVQSPPFEMMKIAVPFSTAGRLRFLLAAAGRRGQPVVVAVPDAAA